VLQLPRAIVFADVVNSNPGNQPSMAICYKAEVPPEWLDAAGSLRNGMLEVKLAVSAAAGFISRCGLTKTKHDVHEVKVNRPGSLVAGTVIKLSPLLPAKKCAAGCKVHAAAAASAAAKGPSTA
jgi:hypothetical protein